MKKLLLPLTLLFVTGCASTGFSPTLDREEVVVKYHLFKTQQELNKAVKTPDSELRGQAVYSPNDNKCDIYISTENAPRGSNAFMKLLGHELLHCLYGDYHK